jgi:hypothetical protein
MPCETGGLRLVMTSDATEKYGPRIRRQIERHRVLIVNAQSMLIPQTKASSASSYDSSTFLATRWSSLLPPR